MIVPCILQSSYTPDGWLGMIVGTKFFIDFTINSFDVALSNLKNEVLRSINDRKRVKKEKDDHLESCDLSSKTTGSANIYRSSELKSSPRDIMGLKKNEVDKNNGNAISNMSSDEVNKWLNRCSIDYRIKRQFTNCDGRILFKFYETKKEAPEYFYSSISKGGSIEVVHVFKFIHELEQLIYC